MSENVDIHKNVKGGKIGARRVVVALLHEPRVDDEDDVLDGYAGLRHVADPSWGRLLNHLASVWKTFWCLDDGGSFRALVLANL